MLKTVVATYSKGNLRPRQPLRLKEGQRVRVTIVSEPSEDKAGEIIRATSGAWADQLDCDEFERDVYTRRHRVRKATRI